MGRGCGLGWRGWIVATEVIVHTSGAEELSKLREVHMESRDRQR